MNKRTERKKLRTERLLRKLGRARADAMYWQMLEEKVETSRRQIIKGMLKIIEKELLQ